MAWKLNYTKNWREKIIASFLKENADFSVFRISKTTSNGEVK
jgi:hypothetical protein